MRLQQRGGVDLALASAKRTRDSSWRVVMGAPSVAMALLRSSR